MLSGVRTVGRWLVWAAVLFLAYQILEDSPIFDELVAGGIIAIVAGMAVARLHRFSNVTYAPLWPQLYRLAGIPFAMLRDTLIVGGAILRSIMNPNALKGKVEHLPMDFGSEKDPRDAARRALVTLATCLAPNRIVCIVDLRGLYVHRLVGSSRPPENVRWPI